MEVICNKEDYIAMQKEVCYLGDNLKHLLEIICSSYDWSDFNLQASSTCEAIRICDMLKNYLVQMNFIDCNVSKVGGDVNANKGLDNNNSNINNTGDIVELYETEDDIK